MEGWLFFFDCYSFGRKGGRKGGCGRVGGMQMLSIYVRQDIVILGTEAVPILYRAGLENGFGRFNTSIENTMCIDYNQ